MITVAGIFDVHVPAHDPAMMDAFLEWCKDQQPDVIIIGGDFMDLESVSSHGGNAYPPKLKDEILEGVKVLKRIRAANKNAVIHYLEGNHETRLTRFTSNVAPALHEAVSLRDVLKLDELDISWHKYGTPVWYGKLSFVHGNWCTDAHAKKHLDAYGCSVTYGHTHRPQT